MGAASADTMSSDVSARAVSTRRLQVGVGPGALALAVTVARDTKGLIAESATHVTQGVDLVQRTRQSLNSIAASIAELAGSIGEISAASREQSSGVEEISTAVMRMDELTQQNAGLAEQSVATARMLDGQATQLAEIVDVFRLDHRAAPVAPQMMAAE